MTSARVTQALLGVPGPAALAALRMRWQQMPRYTRWAWGALALFLLLAMAGIAWMVGARFVAPALAAGVAAVLMLAWAGQMASLLEQNHPQMARLVPGHLRVLRRVAVALWAAVAVAFGSLAWWAFDGGVGFWGCLIASGLLAAALAWCVRWPVLWFVFSFAPALWPLLPARAGLVALGLEAVGTWRAHVLVSTVVVLALLAWSVAALFGRGDAKHARAFERQSAWRAVGRRDGAGAAALGPATRESPFAWLVWPLAAAGMAWLAHLLRRATPDPRSVMARAELVLHGCQHWLWHLLGVGVVLLMLGLVMVALLAALAPATGPVPMDKVWQNGHVGLAIGLTSMGLNALFLLPRALWTSRRDQALLLLLPGMPRGRALNAAVARLQLRHAAVAWTLTAALVLGLYALTGSALGLCLMIVALPMLLLRLLQEPARVTAGAGLRHALPILGYLLGGTLLLAALGWREPAPLALVAAAVLSIGLSVALGVWRWRQLMAAPQALPAGRLA